MQLQNHTAYPARLLKLERDEAVQAVVIVKATYALAGAGQLRSDAAQLPILADRLETPFGWFHGEHFIRKEGVDLMVLGTVRRARPVTEVQVTAHLGAHSGALRVMGDRRWQTQGERELVPGAPRPFTEMPLSYARAYGGAAKFNEEDVVWPDNPVGVGHYLTREQALGHPLPNVEAARGPHIRRWEDQPIVAGWGPYPMFWGLRAREGVEVDAEAMRLKRLRARLNNNANPSLIAAAARPGDAVSLEGLRETPLRFSLPDETPHVHVQTGDQHALVQGAIDTVTIWADEERVSLTHRVHFTYPLRAEQKRFARLEMRPSGARS